MGIRNRQQSLVLPWKNCQVAQADSWRTSPGRGSDASFRDNHTGACVPQWFIYGGDMDRNSQEDGSYPHQTDWNGRTYLHAGGWHLRWLVVDLEPVPARQQRMVTDQVLDGRVLDLR